MTRPLADVLRSELDRGVREGVFPAAAAAVAVGEQPAIAYETAPGKLFDVASLTKPFVATAVHRLRARGRVDLERPVAAYWPEIGERSGVGREHLRALLSHRS